MENNHSHLVLSPSCDTTADLHCTTLRLVLSIEGPDGQLLSTPINGVEAQLMRVLLIEAASFKDIFKDVSRVGGIEQDVFFLTRGR